QNLNAEPQQTHVTANNQNLNAEPQQTNATANNQNLNAEPQQTHATANNQNLNAEPQQTNVKDQNYKGGEGNATKIEKEANQAIDKQPEKSIQVGEKTLEKNTKSGSHKTKISQKAAQQQNEPKKKSELTPFFSFFRKN
ncbi:MULTISPECIES: hypothetical protein, partial [Clostridia]|uniref:hypothetical protein n=1 Tax=Clostridia TaxID=186801 RepID=UPI000EEA551F